MISDYNIHCNSIFHGISDYNIHCNSIFHGISLSPNVFLEHILFRKKIRAD